MTRRRRLDDYRGRPDSLLRRTAQESIVRKLSSMFSTIILNFGNGTANESVFSPT